MKCVATILAMSLLLAAGCQKSAPPQNAPRPRIVSFSPALTAMLFEMGLGDHVVGVTTYCDLPPGQTRPVVGDRHSINIERILSVEPDVMLVQQQESDFDALRSARPGLKIEHFSIETLADIPVAIERVGKIAGREPLGTELRKQFEDRLSAVREAVKNLPRPRVLFLTSFDPPSIAGKSSFLHEMIELAGGEDVTSRYPRWTQINVEQILTMQPDSILCLAEPGQETQAKEYLLSLKNTPAVREGRVYVVIDRHWTIPSTRLAELTQDLAKIIHPGILFKDQPK